jgi:hypothetical protein
MTLQDELRALAAILRTDAEANDDAAALEWSAAGWSENAATVAERAARQAETARTLTEAADALDRVAAVVEYCDDWEARPLSHSPHIRDAAYADVAGRLREALGALDGEGE